MARAYIPVEIERRVRAAAHNRCGYCLSPQHLVMARLEIEHIIPISKDGTNFPGTLFRWQSFTPASVRVSLYLEGDEALAI